MPTWWHEAASALIADGKVRTETIWKTAVWPTTAIEGDNDEQLAGVEVAARVVLTPCAATVVAPVALVVTFPPLMAVALRVLLLLAPTVAFTVALAAPAVALTVPLPDRAVPFAKLVPLIAAVGVRVLFAAVVPLTLVVGRVEDVDACVVCLTVVVVVAATVAVLTPGAVEVGDALGDEVSTCNNILAPLRPSGAMRSIAA